MAERRKYVGKERRGKAGKVFQTAEEIRKKKEEALNKLRKYQADEGVEVKSLFVHAAAIACIAFVVAVSVSAKK